MEYYIPTQLASSTINHVGRCIYCRPLYGWGWNYYDGLKREWPAIPEPFHFHLVELFKWNGVLRGGFGLVAEIDHPYHGRWVSFYTRGAAINDFYNNSAAFSSNVSFFSSRPSLRLAQEDPEMAENWPLLDIYRNPDVRPPNHLALGFGDIAADEDVLLESDRMLKIKQLPANIRPY